MTPVKKTKKDEAVKAVETKKAVPAEAEVKTEAAPAKKAAARKAPAKKAAAPEKKATEAVEPVATVTIEYAGGSIVARNVLDKALESYRAEHKDTVNTIDLYIQPEQGVAYYVVNGEGSEDFRVSL